MISRNIIVRGVLLQGFVIICCIAAVVFGYFALEADYDWDTYLGHAINREDEKEKQSAIDDPSFYSRLYGEKDTEYLLRRNLNLEKIVVIYLLVYLICSIVYLISSFLHKDVGLNKRLYEIFFTASFFLFLIAMAMQFLSMHTYDVNYIQWEIRNGKNVSQYNERTEKFENFYAKFYHPCTSESRLQMSEKERRQLEVKFGANACQYYNTKLSVLVLLVISWIFSFLIIISVTNCHAGSNRVLPEAVPVPINNHAKATKDINSNTIEAEIHSEDDLSRTDTSCRYSTNSSCSTLRKASQNNNITERLLSQFRSELAVLDEDG